MKKNWHLSLILILLLMACSPTAEIISSEEKPIFQIGYELNLETFLPELRTCADENSSAFFDIRPNILMLDDNDLRIQFGEPAEIPKFSAQVGSDEIVVILNKNNQSDLDISELQNIFSGRRMSWGNIEGLGAIQVWLLPTDNNLSQIIQENLLAGLLFSSNARVAPGPTEILEAVSKDPNAIGFLPLSMVNSSVNTIDLQIELPILALADEEPEGGLREFVACLQSN